MFGLRHLSADELIEKGVAPLKKEHWSEKPPAVALPTAEVPLAGEAAPKTKSKRQEKKDRQNARIENLCCNFALGRCSFGEGCRFSHDVSAYVARRRPDLPGRCPFAEQLECPFGIICRWAVSHNAADAFSQEHLHAVPASQNGAAIAMPPLQQEGTTAETKDEQQIVAPKASTAEEHISKAEALLSGTSHDSDAPTGILASNIIDNVGVSANGGSESTISRVCADKKVAAASDSKADVPLGDGSIPSGPVELPVLERSAASVNVLDKNLQHHLRKNTHDFARADAALAAIGAKVVVKGRRSTQPAAKRHKTADEAAAVSADGDALQSKSIDGGALQNGAKPIFDAAAVGAHGDALQSKSFDGGALQNGPKPIFDVRAGARESDDWAGMHVEGPLQHREKRKLDLRGKLYLAPLTTVGNLPFRRVCKMLGADITCGEMALATNLLQGQASEWALLKRHPCEDMFGVQVCGGYPDTMTRCAQLLEECVDVDFVDCNMGCPIDLICNKGAGSAILLKPQRMEQVVRGMASVLSTPLTIKVRRGYHDNADVAHTLLPQVASWGAAAATLHGRSRQQRYTKLADWDYIRSCAEVAAPLPLVGNGDIYSYTDYVEHMEACPQLATVMIARGALTKPWLFTEIKERRHWDISASERLDLLKTFCSAGLLHWGSDERGVETTRRFLLEWLSFLCRYIPVALLEVLPPRMTWRPPFFCGRSDLETLLGSQNPADWVALSEMLLGPAPPGFKFVPKHKSNAYAASEMGVALEDQENG